jgi:hypothetical protein
MTKATASLSPRDVIGNRRRVETLTLKEACAALVATLSGEREIPPRRELRSIASKICKRQGHAAVRSASLKSKGARNV